MVLHPCPLVWRTVAAVPSGPELTPHEPSAGLLPTLLQAVPAGQAIPYCYDTVTRLPEVLPLATPRPTDCTKPVVVDIASTLLQYGIRVGS